MMLQSRYDDGAAMTRGEISDELLTLLTAGHETTATSLAWTVERLRRHPDVLRRLVAEVDPDRFLGVRPGTWNWIPFGGGARRCIGAAFATMEMNIVLRTLLRDFTLEPTSAADERTHFRGVALAPAKKGRAIVRRRPPRADATTAAESAQVTA